MILHCSFRFSAPSVLWEKLGLANPSARHTCAVCPPAAFRRMWMICSSLNLFFLMFCLLHCFAAELQICHLRPSWGRPNSPKSFPTNWAKARHAAQKLVAKNLSLQLRSPCIQPALRVALTRKRSLSLSGARRLAKVVAGWKSQNLSRALIPQESSARFCLLINSKPRHVQRTERSSDFSSSILKGFWRKPEALGFMRRNSVSFFA